jgi:effector-binding domain-containing protein
MMTLPEIVDRPAQPYVAVRKVLKIPFGEAIGPAMGEIGQWMAGHGVTPSGAPFFKYNVVAMPELEIEFGFPTASVAKADGGVIAGTLPAGRYATLTYWGHYDNLMSATAVLVGWAREMGVEFDGDGRNFASRLEIYANDMNTLPPDKWETVLAIKVKGEGRASRA